MIMQQTQTSTQQPSNEEWCNLLLQSLIAKDEKLLLKVLEQDDEKVVKDIINRVPANHVSKLVIELRNILSNKLTVNHLQWLQYLLASKYSVISSMPDGRSILLPLVSLLDDRSSPAYYSKLQGLKGKLTLLKQLREARKTEIVETVVRVPSERDGPTHMEVESGTDTEDELEEHEDEKHNDIQNGEHDEDDDSDEIDDDDLEEDDALEDEMGEEVEGEKEE